MRSGCFGPASTSSGWLPKPTTCSATGSPSWPDGPWPASLAGTRDSRSRSPRSHRRAASPACTGDDQEALAASRTIGSVRRGDPLGLALLREPAGCGALRRGRLLDGVEEALDRRG